MTDDPPGDSGEVLAVTGPSPWGRLAATAGLVLVVLFAVFPHRLEYPAHVLAGMGLGVLGAAGLWSTRWPRVGRPPSQADLDRRTATRTAVIAVMVLAAGMVSDLTLTGPFDVLDVANTTMGGLLGIAAVVPALTVSRATQAARTGLAVTGVVLVLVGLAVRYPVQETVKHWWWFGS